MSGEEESGFTFVDKRRSARESDAAPESAAPPMPQDEPFVEEEPLAAESGAEPHEPDAPGEHHAHPRLRPEDRLLMSIDILHQGAWIALGLVTDPVTGQIEKDLAGARALIDGVAALAEQVGPFLDESSRRDLRSLLSDLRINFVNQQGRS